VAVGHRGQTAPTAGEACEPAASAVAGLAAAALAVADFVASMAVGGKRSEVWKSDLGGCVCRS
jgi:hypothetical protein